LIGRWPGDPLPRSGAGTVGAAGNWRTEGIEVISPGRVVVHARYASSKSTSAGSLLQCLAPRDARAREPLVLRLDHGSSKSSRGDAHVPFTMEASMPGGQFRRYP